MDLNLKNKVALVTGASKGIGLACAKSLASEGCDLIIVSRNKIEINEVSSEISKEYSVKCIASNGDVSDLNFPRKLFKIIKKEFKKLDILVNNSGGPSPGSFMFHGETEWNKALNLNLMSVVRFSKEATSLMKINSYGRIINILSMLAKEPTPNMVLSATARAGVMAFSKATSIELGPMGITINNICPGGVLTDRFNKLLSIGAKNSNKSEKEYLDERVKTVPAGRFANPNEIGNLVSFLASPMSSFINGTNLVIDGGQAKSY